MCSPQTKNIPKIMTIDVNRGLKLSLRTPAGRARQKEGLIFLMVEQLLFTQQSHCYDLSPGERDGQFELVLKRLLLI